MQKIFYDALADDGRGRFLGSKSHKGKIPAHAVPIGQKRYEELIAAQRDTDAAIAPDASGSPDLVFPDPVEVRARLIKAVKAEAQRRIEAVFPVTAQMNAMRLALSDDPRFAFIDAVRAASNLIEQDLAECTDPEKYPITDNPLWPEAD